MSNTEMDSIINGLLQTPNLSRDVKLKLHTISLLYNEHCINKVEELRTSLFTTSIHCNNCNNLPNNTVSIIKNSSNGATNLPMISFSINIFVSKTSNNIYKIFIGEQLDSSVFIAPVCDTRLNREEVMLEARLPNYYLLDMKYTLIFTTSINAESIMNVVQQCKNTIKAQNIWSKPIYFYDTSSCSFNIFTDRIHEIVEQMFNLKL